MLGRLGSVVKLPVVFAVQLGSRKNRANPV